MKDRFSESGNRMRDIGWSLKRHRGLQIHRKRWIYKLPSKKNENQETANECEIFDQRQGTKKKLIIGLTTSWVRLKVPPQPLKIKLMVNCKINGENFVVSIIHKIFHLIFSHHSHTPEYLNRLHEIKIEIIFPLSKHLCCYMVFFINHSFCNHWQISNY